MVLRSGKELIKIPKQSSANSNEIEEEDDDFISRLPDPVLTQILFLLPEADAYRTCILSKRWMNIRAFFPNLRFEIPTYRPTEEVNKLHDAVDRTLALRGSLPINRFILKFITLMGHIYDLNPSLSFMKCDYNRVYDWLCAVVQCDVQEIELCFPADRYRVRFCWNLFKSCETLVRLTLEGVFELDVPKAELLFPCLKKLSLLSIDYSSDQSLENLISGCPVLEELYLERHGFLDNLEKFKLSSPSLKRLKLLFTQNGGCESEVLIDAPKLEYIDIEDFASTNFFLTQPLPLVEACIGVATCLGELVTCLSSIKILTLTSLDIMSRDYDDAFRMLTFPNLVKLVTDPVDSQDWISFLIFLNNMPNLEHITFLKGLGSFPRSHRSLIPPACLHDKVKEIVIMNNQTITRKELNPIRYLLRHSTSLESFTVNAHEIDPEMRQHLLSFERGSSLCQFVFV